MSYTCHLVRINDRKVRSYTARVSSPLDSLDTTLYPPPPPEDLKFPRQLNFSRNHYRWMTIHSLIVASNLPWCRRRLPAVIYVHVNIEKQNYEIYFDCRFEFRWYSFHHESSIICHRTTSDVSRDEGPGSQR